MSLPPLYIILNVFYQLSTFLFLVIANGSVNEGLIPASLSAENPEEKVTGLIEFGYAGLKFIFLITEAALFIFVVSLLNQLFLKATQSDKKRKMLMGKTVQLNVIFTFCFIVIMMWGHFMGGLW